MLMRSRQAGQEEKRAGQNLDAERERTRGSER